MSNTYCPLPWVHSSLQNGNTILPCCAFMDSGEFMDQGKFEDLFFDNIGFSIGDYTSDVCLRQFNMSREEAFDSKMIMACVMGFDLENPSTKEFLDKYIAAATDGHSYPGSWTNENLQVSNDMRCKGHRHDQSVASILIKQMGLSITRAQDTFFAYASHKGLVPIADSVGLWSEGI